MTAPRRDRKGPLMLLENRNAIVYGGAGAMTGTSMNITCGSVVD